MTNRDMFTRCVPRPAGPARQMDWERFRNSWGKKFPSDYRRFIEEYEPGSIQDFLVILEPEIKGGHPAPFDGGVSYETLNAELMWEEVSKSPQLLGAHPRLIAWGVDNCADILCWDASGDDPESWPVLVYQRADVIWQKYDCGMVEFLLRMMRAEFDRNPLSGADLWGVEPVTFRSLREQFEMYGESPYGDRI